MTAVSFRGDITKLRGLVGKLNQVRQASTRKAINKLAGTIVLGGVLDCFQASKSPYGETWKPLKSRDGKPLLDTGRLRNSIKLDQKGDGFAVSTDVVYAPVHQYGSHRFVGARQNVVHTSGKGKRISREAWAKKHERHAKALDALEGSSRDITRKQRRSLKAKQRAFRRFRSSRKLVFTKSHEVGIPARPFFPSKSKGLPKEWRADLHDVVTDYIERLMR